MVRLGSGLSYGGGLVARGMEQMQRERYRIFPKIREQVPVIRKRTM